MNERVRSVNPCCAFHNALPEVNVLMLTTADRDASG